MEINDGPYNTAHVLQMIAGLIGLLTDSVGYEGLILFGSGTSVRPKTAGE